MKITIVGAGKTGRGFLGRLLSKEEITFIDKDEVLVNKLNELSSFDITYFGNKKPKETVSFVKAYTWDNLDKIDADIILVSVGGTNLADVGHKLAKYVDKSSRIIVCENASSPAKKLYDAIGIDGVSISEATVFCTTIEADGLNISSEWYPYLQFDAVPMKDRVPEHENLKPIVGFENFLTRKLFTYNSASCIIAYLGYQKGYTVYSDAANDEEILALLDKNYAAINECMCREFGYDRADQIEFAKLSRDKFTDRTIVDTVSRNAREPQRKIGITERVTGPMLLIDKHGMDSSVLEMTLAAMLLYRPQEETKWLEMLDSLGMDGVLTELAGLSPDSDIYKRVLKLAGSGKII